jgi:amidase
VRFSSPDGYEKFKVVFKEVREHLLKLPGFMHLTWWVHPDDPTWYNEVSFWASKEAVDDWHMSTYHKHAKTWAAKSGTIKHRVGHVLDAPERMILRHPLLHVQHHQHRPLPPLLTTHPPLPPQPRLPTQTNYVDMAIGSDQAGSVRAPSSWCGICGLKPTFGLVPFTGAVTQEFCIDHLGPMTSNVADNALMLEVLAGHDGYDGRQQQLEISKYTAALGRDVRGMTIGVVSEGFGQAASDRDVDECVRSAAARLARMGATVAEVSIPEHITGMAVWAGIILDGLWQTLRFGGLGSNYHGLYSQSQFDTLEHWRDRLAETPINVRILLMLGKYLERYSGRYYIKAKNLGFQLRAAYDAALEKCDLLLMPTTQRKPRPVPKSLSGLSDKKVFALSFINIENTCQFDVSGHPAISIPCGMRDGLPIGMMLIAKHFGETAIYRAAHAFEQSDNWQKT